VKEMLAEINGEKGFGGKTFHYSAGTTGLIKTMCSDSDADQ